MGEYLIHDIRSKYDFSKHYLNPLRTSPRPDPPIVRNAGTQRRRQRREVMWGMSERRERERERMAADELDRAIEKRRWIYRHGLYAKHVASNPYTRYKPFPTPAQFASNPDLISRATIFVRRELRVWDSLDVEFLTTFTVSLMKSIEIRSESAIKLLAEFLDMDTNERTNAEHFSHELYCYLRSPYRDLARYDAVVQYDTPEHVPAVEYRQRSRRWEEASVPESPSASPSPGPSGLHSRSPSPSQERKGGRDSGKEESSSRARNKRPRSRSLEAEGTRYAKEDDHHRRSSVASDQGVIGRDAKGKSRAIDFDYRAHDPSHIAYAESHQPIIWSRAGQSEYHDRDTPPNKHTPDASIKFSSTVAAETPLKVPGTKHGERPKVRREALLAMNAHLLDSSRGRETPKPATYCGQEPSAALPRVGQPPPAELSIRGAAKAAAGASPTPSNPHPKTSPELSYHPTYNTANNLTVIRGTMSSRDIMARTRARLAKLRQDTTLSTATGPKRDEHVVSSLDGLSRIPGTAHTAHDGNHTPSTSTTNSSFSSVTVQPHDVSAAQSFHPESMHPVSDKGDAAAMQRAKLLSRLEREQRAQNGNGDNPHHHNNPSSLVTVEGNTQVETMRPPENIGGSKQLQTEEGLSLRRQDAEMLEKRLRAQAQLRIKLAVAKRTVAGASLNGDGTSNADCSNPMSWEGSLRSRLKRVASR